MGTCTTLGDATGRRAYVENESSDEILSPIRKFDAQPILKIYLRREPAMLPEMRLRGEPA